MYHIPNDLRARHSAALICAGMGECLREKVIADLTVTEVAGRAGVGRATFYRLFDNLEDVLVYQCDALFEETMRGLPQTDGSLKGYMKGFIRQCMEHKELVSAIVTSGRTDLLLHSHRKYYDRLAGAVLGPSGLTRRQTDYVLALLTSAIGSIMLLWQEESVETLYQDCAAGVRYLAELLGGE